MSFNYNFDAPTFYDFNNENDSDIENKNENGTKIVNSKDVMKSLKESNGTNVLQSRNTNNMNILNNNNYNVNMNLANITKMKLPLAQGVNVSDNITMNTNMNKVEIMIPNNMNKTTTTTTTTTNDFVDVLIDSDDEDDQIQSKIEESINELTLKLKLNPIKMDEIIHENQVLNIEVENNDMVDINVNDNNDQHEEKVVVEQEKEIVEEVVIEQKEQEIVKEEVVIVKEMETQQKEENVLEDIQEEVISNNIDEDDIINEIYEEMDKIKKQEEEQEHQQQQENNPHEELNNKLLDDSPSRRFIIRPRNQNKTLPRRVIHQEENNVNEENNKNNQMKKKRIQPKIKSKTNFILKNKKQISVGSYMKSTTSSKGWKNDKRSSSVPKNRFNNTLQSRKRSSSAPRQRKNKKSSNISHQTNNKMNSLTIPQSPGLILKNKLGERRYATTRNLEEEMIQKKIENDEIEMKKYKKKDPLSLTRPEPFHLHESHDNRDNIELASPPLFEKVRQINKTPGRFHSRPVGENKGPTPIKEFINKKMTTPHTPQFITKDRANIRGPSEYLDPEKKIEQILEENEKAQFKALKLDYRIFNSMGELGVPKVEPTSLTEPEPFEFNQSKINKTDNYVSNDEVELNKKFKARPLPKYYRSRSTSRIRSNSTNQIDINNNNNNNMSMRQRRASSGNIGAQRILKKDQKKRRSLQMRSKSVPRNKSKPVFAFGRRVDNNDVRNKKQNTIQRNNFKLTEPEPFNLSTDLRGELHQQSFQEKLRKEDEELKNMREIKARPLPSRILKRSSFNVKQNKKELTEFKEFNLQSVRLHEQARLKEEEIRKNEELKEKEARLRKARPLPNTTFQPKFQIKYEERKPIEPLNIHLHSDKRAIDRELFDESNKNRLIEMENEKLQREKQRHEEEEYEIRKLRNTYYEKGGFNFHAQEIKQYPLGLSERMVKPLTEPESPFLLTKQRGRIREVNPN